MLSLRVHPGQREAAAQAFARRRVLEECAEAIPGFLGGELMLSQDDPDLMYVSALWDGEASYRQWLASPVRAAQGPHLAIFLAQAPSSTLLEMAHSCNAPP
ncbi:antibiotic biosynthesis monooxygenase family protein [Verticiella sediminum]|uniref:antibiotic biosynthesis monooxygenase family protein n=1 Tax=Verticiella sediminum TaxID=1247510 RepID=UPI001478D9DA|nr:antibiotic biosynthesis monooxygenase family protein [Verticiella sediminum]